MNNLPFWDKAKKLKKELEKALEPERPVVEPEPQKPRTKPEETEPKPPTPPPPIVEIKNPIGDWRGKFENYKIMGVSMSEETEQQGVSLIEKANQIKISVKEFGEIPVEELDTKDMPPPIASNNLKPLEDNPKYSEDTKRFVRKVLQDLRREYEDVTLEHLWLDKQNQVTAKREPLQLGIKIRGKGKMIIASAGYLGKKRVLHYRVVDLTTAEVEKTDYATYMLDELKFHIYDVKVEADFGVYQPPIVSYSLSNALLTGIMTAQGELKAEGIVDWGSTMYPEETMAEAREARAHGVPSFSPSIIRRFQKKTSRKLPVELIGKVNRRGNNMTNKLTGIIQMKALDKTQLDARELKKHHVTPEQIEAFTKFREMYIKLPFTIFKS